MAKKKQLNFEKSLTRLEEITQKMEEGDLTLDESLKLFEEGVNLSRFCEKKLVDAETKVNILQSTEIIDEEEENPIEENDKTKKKISKKKELLCSNDTTTNEDTQEDDTFLF